jgi:hypothetical protein
VQKGGKSVAERLAVNVQFVWIAPSNDRYQRFSCTTEAFLASGLAMVGLGLYLIFGV